MKRIYQILVLAILVILNTSWLKSGLDELETYNLNDITNVRFEYRWWNESEQRMRIIEMNVDKSIDKENKKISCTITVPEATKTFTSDIRSQVSLSTLAINVDASTASRISPVGNAPVMGTFPSDFSDREFVYEVKAGNGDIANWTIQIIDFKK